MANIKRGIGDIQNEAIQKMSERFAVTWLGTRNPGKRFDENPNFDVYEYSPDKKLDGDKRDYLWGSDGSIIEQSSIVKAVHDSLARRFGFNIKFEEFWSYWEQGFKGFQRQSKVAGLQTNYPENDVRDGAVVVSEAWRKNKASCPAFIEWTPRGQTNFPLRIIEYFPDKSNSEVSKLFMGSDWTIIRDIIQYSYEGGNSVVGAEEIANIRIRQKTSGHPRLVFCFYKYDNSSKKKYQTKIGYSLVEYVEDSSLATKKEKVLTTDDIKLLAERIRKAFVEPSPFILKKGRQIWSYQFWPKGYRMWSALKSQSVAIDLYSRLLGVRLDVLDDRYMRFSQAANPSKVYETVQKIKVLGKEVKQQRHPIVDVPFNYAYLDLPVSGQRHILASASKTRLVSLIVMS